MTAVQESKKGDYIVFNGAEIRNYRDNAKAAAERSKDHGGFMVFVPLGADIAAHHPARLTAASGTRPQDGERAEGA